MSEFGHFAARFEQYDFKYLLVQEAIVLLALASTRITAMADPETARVTQGPVVRFDEINGTSLGLRRRVETELSTCGYYNGDPTKPRTANSGFNCRVDTQKALWGFCPTTVISAQNCGLAGGCIDSHACSNGCGMPPNTDITTFTCAQTQFCSTALLTFGVDQTYSYIACGAIAVTDHLQISPTATAEISSTTVAPPTLNTSPPASNPSLSPQRSRNSISNSAFSAGPTGSETSGGERGIGGGNNTGAIIGGVIGGLALLGAFGLGAIYLLQRDRRRNPRSPTAGGPTSATTPRWIWFARKASKNGGWGPRELPAADPAVLIAPSEPVELPAATLRA